MANPIDDVIQQYSSAADSLRNGLATRRQEAQAHKIIDKEAGPRPSKANGIAPPADLQGLFDAASAKYGVPVNVLSGLAQQESNYDGNAVGAETKWGRAKGILQNLDSTAEALGINPFDVAASIDAGAKQFKERLDKGYSIEEAIAAHHGGDNREQWGPKTKQYVSDVMAKAGTIGESMMPKPADTASYQQQLDAEEPGRYQALSAEEASRYQKRDDLANGGVSLQGGLDAFTKAANDKRIPAPLSNQSRESVRQQLDAKQPELAGVLSPENLARGKIGQPPVDTRPLEDIGAAGATIKQSAIAGGWDLAAAGVKLVDATNPFTWDEADIATIYKDDPQGLADYHAGPAGALNRFAEQLTLKGEAAMADLSPEARRQYGSLEYATTDMDNSAFTHPVKIVADAVRSAPSSLAMMTTAILTRGASVRAESAALQAGASAEVARQIGIKAAVKMATTVGAGSEGAIGYAQQVSGTRADINAMPQAELEKSPLYQKLITAGYSPEAARSKVTAKVSEDAGQFAGIVDASVNAVGGQFLGKILAEGGKVLPRMGKGLLNEAATEGVQSPGEKLGENIAMRDIDPNKDLLAGTGEAAMQGIAVGGLSGGLVGGLAGKGSDGIKPADAPAPSAVDPVDPAVGDMPADTGRQDPPISEPNPLAEVKPVDPVAPAGPLARAAAKAAPVEGTELVTVTKPNGQTVTGHLDNYEDDGAGNWTASLLTEDGYQGFSSKNGTTISQQGANPLAELPAQPVAASDDRSDTSEPSYDQRVADRISRVESAKTKEDADSIVSEEEHKDGERHFEGTAAVERAASARKRTLDREAVERQKVDDYQAGKWITDVRGNDDFEGAQAIVKRLKAEFPDDEFRIDKTEFGEKVRQRKAPAEKDVETPSESIAGNEADKQQAEQAKASDEPAPIAAEPKPAKWFGSAAKAYGYVDAKKLGDTHEVVDVGGSRFEIREKAAVDADPAPALENELKPAPEPTVAEKIGEQERMYARRHSNRLRKIANPETTDAEIESLRAKLADDPRANELDRQAIQAAIVARQQVTEPVAADQKEPAIETVLAEAKAGADDMAERVKAHIERQNKQPEMPREEFKSAAGIGSISAVQQRHGGKYGVSFASTSIAEVGSMEEAAAIAKAVAESGVDNIVEMRELAKSIQQKPVDSAKARRLQPGDEGYTLLDARNDLIEARAEFDKPVADARIGDRVRQLESLVKEMEAQQKAPADKSLSEQMAAMSNDELSAMLDGITAEHADVADTAKPVQKRKTKTAPKTGEPKPRKTVAKAEQIDTEDAGEVARTAAEMAKSLTYNTSSAGLEAMKGLVELFGGGGKLSSGLTFDEESYAKAKPHFQAALKDAQAAGRDLKEFFTMLLQQFGSGVKPYIIRFANDQRDEARHDVQPTEAVARTGDAGSQPAGVPAPEQAKQTGPAAGAADSGVRAVRGSGDAAGAKPSDGIDGQGQGGGNEQPARADRGNRTEPSGGSAAVDYRIQPGELKREGSWRATAERNVDIVELAQQIQAESRPATPEEQAKLTKFTGWGASEIANGIFPNQYGRYKDERWHALGERLKAALSAEEYAQAKRTTQYAHYTSEPIIRSVHAALDRLGFAGGNLLEPGMGIGLFNGLMPDAMAANSQYTGIEYDSTTGGIAKLLYPDSNIIVGDYTATKLPRDFYDAAIGNPPFGQIKIQSDPEYKKQGFLLHDYFFAKTIDRVKPGGVLVFVTSKGTMDKATDRARKYLGERADLLGAIRLPQTAFKDNAGTEVVTDVIFLRKRMPGEAQAGEQWAGLGEVQTAQGPAQVNEYFAAHPEMVLGRHAKTGSMYRSDEYTVEPIDGDIEQLFSKAVENLPANVYRAERGSTAEQAVVIKRDYDPKIKKEGGLYVAADGTLMQVESGSGVPLTQRIGSAGKLVELRPAELEWLKGYTAVRDALKQAQYDQLNDGKWEASLKALNKAYDTFTKAHGQILANTATEKEQDDGSVTVTRRFKNDSLIRQDAEGALAYALEEISASGVISKGPALKGRVLNKPAAPTITNVQDAMFVTLNQLGRFDLPTIAALAGKSPDEVIAELGAEVYEDPSSGWTTADDYLSGNVVRKLKEAEQAGRTHKQLARNIEALKAVQPQALAPQDITVQLGSGWIPASDVQNFASEVMQEKLQVSRSTITGQWDVSATKNGRLSEWGSANKSPADIMESVLNGRQLKVTYKDADNKTYTDLEATEKVNDIAKKLRAEFKKWVWTDAVRAKRLASYYNEHFNNIAPRQFDGSHLTLPGVSSRFNLHPHQKRAIWRTIQQGDVYYAHAVGAGKTFSMIASGMEERRLGLVKKPMYVVPNHMLAQFSKEFLELYPAAQIMVADETNFHTHNRRKFIAQAALNDPDAIVITHSAFGRIGMSAEYTEQFIQQQISDWQAALDEADTGDRVTVKQIERRIEQLENRMKAAIDGKKDQTLNFEDLGVDRLYVDEGHEFRKLDFPTNRSNIKGIDPNGSQKAMDLAMKVGYLRSKNPNRSLVMASGTPVTNTMGELYTVQRFFQPDQLEEDGDNTFDAWASHYGETVDGLEQNAAGGYETVSRFAKFVNVPELMSRVRSFMDILTSEQLGDLVSRPDVAGGGRRIVVTPSPTGYKAYQQLLEARIKSIRARRGPPKPGDDIILKVISDGRFSAIDMRFVDPTMPSDPDSKLNVTIDAMLAAYHATAANEYASSVDGKLKTDPLKGGAMMLFTDIGLGEQSAETRGFDMKAWIAKRLIAGGVKEGDIAFMRENKAHAKKERLFDDLRQGRKRILIGGKDMETGVNAQKRLTNLFHLDAPWFPASVEQREGRIIRQGNQNKEVNIDAFASKGSYDATMWGMNARKKRFIEQAMSGDTSVRSLEDVSEASAFEMAAALASGDERYMKLAGLKGDVERLSRLESAHETDQRRLRREKISAEENIAYNGKRIGEIKAAIKVREPIKAGEFSAKVGKTTYDSREAFSNALMAKFKSLAEAYVPGTETIGSIGGFPIEYDGLEIRGGNFAAQATVVLPVENGALISYPMDPDSSVQGIATRAANMVNGLEHEVAKREGFTRESQESLDKINRRLGASFPEQSDLNEKRQELVELESELEAESKEANADAAAATVEVEGEQPMLSVAKQPRRASTKAALTEALRSGKLGDVLGKRIDEGKIVIHNSASTIPDIGDLQGVAGVSTVDGVIHLNAAKVRPGIARSVALHEVFHSGTGALIGSKAWDRLNVQLGVLRKRAATGSARLRALSSAAHERIAIAESFGSQMTDSQKNEEFGAYLVEEYENLPSGFKSAVDEILGYIKAWVTRLTGRQVGEVTPEQLRSLAVMALRSDRAMAAAKVHANSYSHTTPEAIQWMVDNGFMTEAEADAELQRGDTDEPAAAEEATTAAIQGRSGEFQTSAGNSPGAEWKTSTRIAWNAGGSREPAKLYRGSRSGRVTPETFNRLGASTGFAPSGLGVWFTTHKPAATGYAESTDGKVGEFYLDLRRPKKYTNDTLPNFETIEEYKALAAKLRQEGYDGVALDNTSAGGYWEFVAFEPDTVITKSPKAINDGRGPMFSILPDDTALDDAITALDGEPQLRPDRVGDVLDDIGIAAKFILHPRQIASLYKNFTKVYTTAINQFEMRDSIIDELQQDHREYDQLSQDSKQKVNAVLELGRLMGRSYNMTAVTGGISNTGEKSVMTVNDSGTRVVSKEPIYPALSKAGDKLLLTEAEAKAYKGLRRMFDAALDKFRDQTLTDFGFPELVGVESPAQAIMQTVDKKTTPEQLERLSGIADFILEIESAKLTGYVPFSRYGEYYVAVKETAHPLKLIHDPDTGEWITRDLPAGYEDVLTGLGAKFDKKEAGYRLNADQRKALKSHNETTVYSAKVEFTLQDKALLKLGRKASELPSVKAALAEAEKWKAGKSNRHIDAGQVIEKSADGQLRLSDVDALAEVAMIDPATWDAVREQLGDAIKGKSFRKHFIQSNSVPGYSDDFERSIADYMAGMAGYLSRRHFNNQWEDEVGKIKEPKLFEYAGKYRAYVNQPQEELAMLRQVGFLYYIAGVPATAFVNLTQPLLMTIPALGQVAPMRHVVREMGRAYKDALRMMSASRGLDLFDPSKAPADLKESLTQAWADGMFVPLQTFEIMATAQQRNVGKRKIARGFSTLVQTTSLLFGFAERLNRLVTFIASARLAEYPGVKARAKEVFKDNHLARETLLKNWSGAALADFMIDETQYRMGKVNRPTAMRSYGAVIMQFKGFVLQSLELWFRMISRQGLPGVKAAAQSLLAMVLIGGAFAIPGADDFRDLVEKAYKQVTGEDLDVKTAMRMGIYEGTGQRWLSEIASKGATYPMGLDMSRVGMGNISPDSTLQVFGIPADLFIGRPSRSFSKAVTGDYSGAVGELLPNMLKNPITALGWTQEGVRDSRGQSISTAEETSGASAALKSIGFQPSQITNIRDYEYAQRRMETANDDLKRSYVRKIAGAYARMNDGTPEQAAKASEKLNEVLAEISEHNSKASGPEDLILIGRTSIKNHLKREMGGVQSSWGRERKQARGASAAMREGFGLEEEQAAED